MDTKNCHMFGFVDSRYSFCGLAAFFVLFLHSWPMFAVTPAKSSDPPYPDMFSCTAVEINFVPSTLAYVDLNDEVDVLSSDERKYLESLNKIVCNDRNLIGSLAHSLSFGHYAGPAKGVRMKFPIHIVGYQNGKRIQSFKMNAMALTTEAGHLFEYAGGS